MSTTQDTPTEVGGYSIGAESITFSERAGALAGKTETRWFVKEVKTDRKVISGLLGVTHAIAARDERIQGDLDAANLATGLPVDDEDFHYAWDSCIGLYRVTSCCKAATSVNDGPLYCKACYEEQDWQCDGEPTLKQHSLTLVTGRGNYAQVSRYLYGGNAIVAFQSRGDYFVAVVINTNDRESYQSGRLSSGLFGVCSLSDGPITWNDAVRILKER